MLFFRKKSPRDLQAGSGPDPGHDTGRDDRLYRSAASAWPETIRQQVARLRDLSGGTEGEFLHIGSRLHDFYDRAVKISETSGGILDETGETALAETADGLKALADKMTNLLVLMEGEAKRCREILGKTLQLIARVDEPLAGFRKIMKVLHVLGISTKIESSRLSQLGTGFYGLANDVERLAVLIHEKSTNILDENSSLTSRINDILNRVINNESTQYEHVGNALHNTYANLTDISELRGRYAGMAETIASASRTVSQHISEVVTSMQFHDITRQRLEHVGEALACLDLRVGEGYDPADDGARLRHATEVASVCQLQAAQLLHAKEELLTAVSSIIDNLNGITDHHRLIAHTAGSVMQRGGTVSSTLFAEIEKNLLAVAKVVLESGEITRELAEAVEKVAQTVGVISTFVVDIETIGEEIKLIAINSQIRAAHTGEEGAALGVLAEAIQRLSVDACHQTVTVSDTLREVSTVTDELCNSDVHVFDNIEAQTENLSHEIGDLVGLLQRMDASLSRNLQESDEAVQLLVADVASTTGGITIHDAVGSGIDGVVAELQTVLGQARELEPDLKLADLSSLSDRYTMHSERRVHAAVTGQRADIHPAGGEPLPLVASAMDEAGGGLGANVELF